jgi:uncharacterized SAM-binding protein YcdF (DUF218 family)
MLFIFSKIAYFFLAPLNWVIGLFFWRFFTKSSRLKKRLAPVIIILVFFFGNEVIYTKSVVAWQPKIVVLNDKSNYEAGILLGGLSSFDKYRKGFLNGATDRLVEICILYKTNKIKRIIISGGSIYADRPKEADFLFKKLLLLGIPAGDLIAENQSRTTAENAAYTKKIIDSMKLRPPFVLVTSAVHIPRAQKVFAKAGISVIPFPSDYHVFDKKFDFTDYVIPKVNVMNDWASFLKEVIGIWGYKVFNKA